MADWPGWLLHRGLITPAQRTGLEEQFAAGRAYLGRGEVSLIHRDLWPEHFFCDPVAGKLTSFIDFGDTCFGPPALEFAHFGDDHVDLWRRELLAAYGLAKPLPPDFHEQIEFFRLVNAVRTPAADEPWAPREDWPNLLRHCLDEIARQLGS